MKRFATILAVAAVCSPAGTTGFADQITLQIDPNEVFSTYATTDGTRLEQLGTARSVTRPDDHYYQTYNDAARDSGAEVDKDLLSVANALEWTAAGGWEGMSHLQLWLNGARGTTWGEQVVMKPYTTIANSMNGQYDWTAYVVESPWDATEDNGTYEPGTDQYGITVFNTVLGGEGHQNAISPTFHPADTLWSITGDFYVDNNNNSVFDAGDSDLVVGQKYPILFFADCNYLSYTDGYGNVVNGYSGPPTSVIRGTLLATAVAVPEPGTLGLLALGALTAGAAARIRRRRRLFVHAGAKQSERAAPGNA
jgi:hypothetical protein